MGAVALTPGQHLEFSFNPESATFSRSGADLVISGDNGAGLTLKGFFVAENADTLPQFILPGGDSVPASSYLQSLNIDITTAAGPAPTATPPSSGEGEYADGAGDLIGGLDRLGSLGTDQWSGSMRTAEIHVDSARNLDNVTGGGASDGGNPEIIAFNARAVLYMQHEGTAPGAQPYDTRSVTVQALAENNGTWEASGQNANTIAAHPANPLDVNALLVWAEDGNGNVTFSLSAAGKAWMAAHPGQDIAAYYVISDANGKAYTLQVVISADGTFDSSSEHNGYLDPNGLIHGEWHDGKDLSQETGYKTTSSNLSDDLRYTGKLTGAEINTGYAADKNWGNDSVTIEGEVQQSTITSGSGDDMISITGNVTGSTIDTGTGAGDTVDIRGKVFSNNATDNNMIKAVDGSVTVTAQGASIQAVSASGANARNTIIGNTVDITAEGTTSAQGVYAQGPGASNTITGTEEVTITATGGTRTTGLSAETAGQNTIRDTGSVSITADGSATSVDRTHTDGVRAFLGGSNLIDNIDGDVTILAKSNSAESITNGLFAAHLGTNTISNVSGATTITATSEPGSAKNNTAVKAAYGGRNIIDVDGPVTLEASADNSEYTPYAYNIAMEASGSSGTERARNEITSADKVTLKVSGGELTLGMSASDGGHNKITALGEGGVEITAVRPTDWYHGRIAGMEAIGDLSLNEINSRNGVAISVEGKSYQTNAMSASTFGENIIRGGEGSTVKFSVQGDTKYGATAKGMYAAYGGMNTITSLNGADGKVGLVEILARGGGTNEGMLVVDRGRNSIEDIGGDVKITAEGANSYGMRVQPSTAMNTSGSNNISHVGGNVEITATGGANSTGMSAEDLGARNTIEDISGLVKITASGTGGVNTGMSANKGVNEILSAASVAVTAENGGSNRALYSSGGGSNVIAASGDVSLTATGTNALGVYAHGGTADITGKNVTIAANSSASSGWTRGLQSTGGTIAVHSTGGTVQIDAHGKEAYAMSAEGDSGSILIEGAKKVILNADYTGMNAAGTSSNTIDGGEVHITVDGQGASHSGMYAAGSGAGATNSILNAAGVTIEALKGGSFSTGVNAGYLGKNIITSTGDVVVTAKDGTSMNYGLTAAAGSNSITSGGDVKITATGNATENNAIRATQGGTTDVAAANGTVTLTAAGGTVGRGIYAAGGSKVDVTAENMTITTNGTSSSIGMHAQNSSTINVHSKGGTVEINALGLQGYNGYGMMGEYQGATLIEGAKTVNITVNQDAMCALNGGSNTIKGSGVAGSEVNIHTKASGMYADRGNASNTITGMETVHIGDKDNRVSLGMSAYTAENRIDGAKTVDVYAKGNAMTAGALAGTAAGNTIQADSVTLDAAGSSISRGMNASDNERVVNTINANDVTIKASGTTAGYGMAVGSKAENTINAGSVNITASNTVYAYGMHALTEGKNTINADSSVEITAAGTSEGRGMAAGGAPKGVSNYNYFQGSNTINAGAGADVTIKASGSAASIGMDAVNKGTNTIASNGGEVSVIARGGESYGMSTSGENESANLITGAAKVTVAADKTGMSANRGTNTITDIHGAAGEKVVEIIADGASAAARSGMYAANHHGNSVNTISENRIEDVTGNVAVTASGVGGSNVAMNAYTVAHTSGLGVGSAKNIITGVDGDVTLSALNGNTNYAMRAFAASGSNPTENIIEDVSGKVTLRAAGGAESYGMSASGLNATNTIRNAGSVDITASSTGSWSEYEAASIGMRAWDRSANSVKADGNVNISASGGSTAAGVNAGAGGANSITASGDVDISASDGRANYGMIYTGVNYLVSPQLANTITADGDVRIKASDGLFNTGMYAAYFGANEITKAASVTVTAEGAGAGLNAAMHADGYQVRGTVGAFNSIHDVAGAVKLVAEGAVGEGSLAFRQGNIGMLAANGAQNLIYNAGSVDILAESPDDGVGTYGMKATGGSSDPAHPTLNHIHDIAGKVSITAEGGKDAYGMSASSGVNRIENTGGMDISATGVENSYAMHAVGRGTNTITNNNGDALIVVIKATGGSLGNYAMFAETESGNEIIGGAGNDVISLKGDIYTDGTGQNIINTGAGDDRILLDGKVTGHLSLDAGDGYDILVLRAASWDEFTDRYQAWLTANFDTMNIESIQWALDNPAGAVPAWLQDLVHDYNTLHPSEPIDFSQAAMTDLAHIVAGDVSNIIDHDGDVSAAHMPDHTSSGHGLAAFGDGDDYVHVKGGVDHVDFTLGGGHNSLHVEGNIVGAEISGGDNGNDIRVGGSFDGAIDLGLGNDRVELGALHDGIVNLGAGDDHLILNGFTGGTVDGGAGHDILTLNLGGHGGAGAFAADGAFSGLFTPGAVQNFEELHFDLSGGGDDSLELDSLLHSLRDLTGGAQTTVRITGDVGSDHVDTHALSAGGWTSSVDSVTGETQWTHAGSEDANLIILIQHGLN